MLFGFNNYFESQPCGFNTRVVDAGYFNNASAGRIGLGTKFPPQFGHWFCNLFSAQFKQNVHSKVQITACLLFGGKSTSQHSQFGLNSNI